MQSNIWENRGRLWWTESPPKSAQKSTRERSFFRRKVDKERGQKRNGIMWEKFPKGGEGSDPNPLHIFFCFFSNSGAYKMAKKNGKKCENSQTNVILYSSLQYP